MMTYIVLSTYNEIDFVCNFDILYAHHVGNQVSHFVLSQIKCDTCIDDTVDTNNA
jgi:hypothetical protein